jgi:hypothetical protein
MVHRQKAIQYAAALWVLVVSAMVAASAFPSYVEHVDPAFRDLGCQGCHASGTPNSVVLKAKLISPDRAPTIDGVTDTVWGEADLIRINLTGGFNPISEPGEESWAASGAPLPWGTANKTIVEIRALYDGETAGSHLYLQVQYLDETQSTHRNPWYFNTETGAWAQADSTLWNEDKFAMFWDMNQVTGFQAGGCLVTCHATTPNRTEVRKYTPQAGDLLDMWTFRSARLNGVNQIDDSYMDYNIASRAIHSDPMVNSSLGYKNNQQSLNNGSKNVNVPLYWIPGRANYDWILLSEVESGTAKQIMSVDANNTLWDSDGTALPSSAMVPSLYASPMDGDRGHVAAHGVWGAGKWTVEASRTLQTTAVVDNQTVASPNDVQFTDPAKSYYFAIAVFDNVGSGHMWHPGPYRLVFGDTAKPAPANLDVWGTSVAGAAFMVSGVGALALAQAAAAKRGPPKAGKKDAPPPAGAGKSGGGES